MRAWPQALPGPSGRPGDGGATAVIKARTFDRLRLSRTPDAAGVRQGPELAAADGRTLLVASTGGHLEQLLRLRDRLADSVGETEWATFAGHQSRSLLSGDSVHYVPYVKPRDLSAAAKVLPEACRILRDGQFRALVSTGAGIAVPFFLAARAGGIPCYYIESAARASGPSLTGRIVSHIPGVRLYTQYPEWADARWSYAGSLFDAFEPGPPEAAPLPPGAAVSRVVVTLGTMPEFGFRRAVEKLVRTLPEVCTPDAEMLWQVGASDLSGLSVAGRAQIPADELRTAIREADLVIAHGGIGSALLTLDSGRVPVLLPRRRAFDEHIDDHQVMICDHLGRRGLAVSREVADLRVDDLWAAAHSSAAIGRPCPIDLGLHPNERFADSTQGSTPRFHHGGRVA